MIRTNAITGGARGRAKLNESTGQKLLRSLRGRRPQYYYCYCYCGARDRVAHIREVTVASVRRSVVGRRSGGQTSRALRPPFSN